MTETGTNTLVTLKKRRDFLRLSRGGRRWVTPAFILQAMPDNQKNTAPSRVGYTASKKVGNAVVRNRVKRRLREIARSVISSDAPMGWTYVIIGRETAHNYPFEKLLTDMKWAIRKLQSGADLAPKSNNKHKKRESSQGAG